MYCCDNKSILVGKKTFNSIFLTLISLWKSASENYKSSLQFLLQSNPRCNRIRSKIEFLSIESADLNTADTVCIYTVRLTHSRTNALLWSEMMLVWETLNDINSHTLLLSFWLQTDMNWIFQMRYCRTL